MQKVAIQTEKLKMKEGGIDEEFYVKTEMGDWKDSQESREKCNLRNYIGSLAFIAFDDQKCYEGRISYNGFYYVKANINGAIKDVPIKNGSNLYLLQDTHYSMYHDITDMDTEDIYNIFNNILREIKEGSLVTLETLEDSDETLVKLEKDSKSGLYDVITQKLILDGTFPFAIFYNAELGLAITSSSKGNLYTHNLTDIIRKEFSRYTLSEPTITIVKMDKREFETA